MHDSVHLTVLILYSPGSPTQGIVPTTIKRGHLTSINIINIVPQRYILGTRFPGEYRVCRVDT